MSNNSPITGSGGFVAGTPVHTKNGLRPIEQIKVGDYVLSKPESGKGEGSYKQVVKTYEHENREVWYVSYTLIDDISRPEYVVVSPDHRFWVNAMEGSRENAESLTWAKAIDLDRYVNEGKRPIFELQHERTAECDCVGPMLRMRAANFGVVYSEFVGDGNPGIGVDFSKGYAELQFEAPNKLKKFFVDLEPDEPHQHLELGSVAKITNGYAPLLRKVYNLEVEENHTYFVGAAGVLVHNTSGEAPANP